LRNYMLAGSMPGLKKKQNWFDEKFLRKGETLDELAAACGINAANLKASIERFNGFARNGRADDFHRGESAYEQWRGAPSKSTAKCATHPMVKPSTISVRGPVKSLVKPPMRLPTT